MEAHPRAKRECELHGAHSQPSERPFPRCCSSAKLFFASLAREVWELTDGRTRGRRPQEPRGGRRRRLSALLPGALFSAGRRVQRRAEFTLQDGKASALCKADVRIEQRSGWME